MHVTRYSLLIISIVLFNLPNAVFAFDLQQEKNNCSVGELGNGYIGAVVDNPSQALVTGINDVNQKRRQKYSALATKKGQSIDIIEALAAQKLYSRLKAGQCFKNPQGSWQKK